MSTPFGPIEQLLTLAEHCQVVLNRLFTTMDESPVLLHARCQRLAVELLAPRLPRDSARIDAMDLTELESQVELTTWEMAQWAIDVRCTGASDVKPAVALEQMAPLLDSEFARWWTFARWRNDSGRARANELQREGAVAPERPWYAATGRQVCVGLGRTGRFGLVLTCSSDTRGLTWTTGFLPGIQGAVALPDGVSPKEFAGYGDACVPRAKTLLLGRDAVETWTSVSYLETDA